MGLYFLPPQLPTAGVLRRKRTIVVCVAIGGDVSLFRLLSKFARESLVTNRIDERPPLTDIISLLRSLHVNFSVCIFLATCGRFVSQVVDSRHLWPFSHSGC